jgi:hypothetical protein
VVELEGGSVSGMAFMLWDGRASWDRAGMSRPQCTLHVAKGDVLYVDVFLDPGAPPRELMVEWNDGSREHRAYWGENTIEKGQDQSPSRRSMGALPAVGDWVRLRVPASEVGLEGREVRGMAFVLSNGRVAWNGGGVLSPPLLPALLYAPGVI